MTISGAGLGPPDGIDLGLNSRSTLPKELGGTRVLFNGKAAPILATSWDRVICVVPNEISGWTAVQAEFENQPSNSVVTVTTGGTQPGLLTRNLPEQPPRPWWAQTAEGNVRNVDGTPNGPDNPAAPGSTIYIFATGMSSVAGLEAGSIATAETPLPGYIYAGGMEPVTGVTTVRGFVTALARIPLKAPAGSGIHAVSISNEWFKKTTRSWSNPIWVYVK